MNPSLHSLRQVYYRWLSSPSPHREGGGHVAGEKTIRGFRRGEQWAEEDAAVWQEAQASLGSPGVRLWVWSDLHLFHKNIIRYSGRPFYSLDEMNASVLSAAQAVVGPEDWVFFLGDLSFGSMAQTQEWLSHLPGKAVTLLGNHDVDRQEKLHGWRSLGFKAVADVQAWDLPTAWEMADGLRIHTLWFTHYPLANHLVPAGVLNVHGHTHDKNLGGRRLNVSVEQLDYRPQELRSWVERHTLLPLIESSTP